MKLARSLSSYKQKHRERDRILLSNTTGALTAANAVSNTEAV